MFHKDSKKHLKFLKKQTNEFERNNFERFKDVNDFNEGLKNS